MPHKMHLWISEMYQVLFNGFLERLNANCHPPSIELDQTEGEFRLEPFLFIRGDAINPPLQLDSDTLRVKQDPGCGFCLSIG
jgi:hypothetical protein